MSTGNIKAAWRIGLGCAALIAAAAAAHGVEQGVPLDISAEGSFPLKYTETARGNTRQDNTSAAPYLALEATAHWLPDFSTSLFTDGGHDRLGGFRDTDNTFFSFGGNAVKHWSNDFLTGVSIEHTNFYDGSFGPISNTANDLNFFARYNWRPNPDLRIVPSAGATMRLNENLAVQRYTYHMRVELEQRLYRDLWLVVAPRVRYLNYVGDEAGRRDVSVSLLAGFKYELAKDIDFRALAGVEDRSSTVQSKSFDKLIVGASIDFKIDFARAR